MEVELPEGWTGTTLGELTKIAGGTTPRRNEPSYWDDGEHLWATPTDITALASGERRLQKTASLISAKAVARGGAKLHPPGTLLMTSRATIGYCAIATVPTATNQGFSNFYPSDTFFSEYLLHWLEWKRELLIQNAGGSTFKEISKKTLRGIQIVLPPLPEQQRIAEILTAVDDSIRAGERVFEQTERVKKGLMEELLTGGLGSAAIERGEVPEGWNQSVFEALVRLKRGYDLPVSQRVEGGVPVVASNGPVGTHNEAAVKSPVVVTGRSGTIGKVALYEDDCHPLNTTLYSENTHGNEIRFIYYFMIWFRLERFGTGTGVPTLNRNDVHAQKIVIPPLPEQTRIASILTSIDEQIAAERKHVEQQKRLKRGLMDDLLTGRVRTV